MNIDYITAAFQSCASIFICTNIYRLIKDREIKGVSMWMIAFFTVWGYWGIIMFHVLDQPISMWTNVAIAASYTVWLGLAVYFKLKRARMLPGE